MLGRAILNRFEVTFFRNQKGWIGINSRRRCPSIASELAGHRCPLTVDDRLNSLASPATTEKPILNLEMARVELLTDSA